MSSRILSKEHCQTVAWPKTSLAAEVENRSKTWLFVRGKVRQDLEFEIITFCFAKTITNSECFEEKSNDVTLN